MTEPFTVWVDLADVPQEVVEAEVQKVLRDNFPDTKVVVFPAGHAVLPDEAVNALQSVLSRGPAAMLEELQRVMAQPEAVERMGVLFGEIGKTLPVASDERAPDYIPEESD